MITNIWYQLDWLDASTKVVNESYNLAKTMAPKIESALNMLGKDLKVGANEVWNILCRQQLVWSICYLILTLAAILNWYFFL